MPQAPVCTVSIFILYDTVRDSLYWTGYVFEPRVGLAASSPLSAPSSIWIAAVCGPAKKKGGLYGIIYSHR